MFIRVFVLLALSATSAFAQQLVLPPALERELRLKADEVTEVDLDATMLGLARHVLSDRDPEQATAKKVIDRLNGIHVRVFEFAEANAYTTSQLEPLRAQLAQGPWRRVVNVRSSKAREFVEVYLRMENGAPVGLAVIAAEPKELAFVHIDGPVSLSELGRLGGKFGIPDIGLTKSSDAARPLEEN